MIVPVLAEARKLSTYETKTGASGVELGQAPALRDLEVEDDDVMTLAMPPSLKASSRFLLTGEASHLEGRQGTADGTLKALSMKYFDHDYATAAAGIDPASLGTGHPLNPRLASWRTTA